MGRVVTILNHSFKDTEHLKIFKQVIPYKCKDFSPLPTGSKVNNILKFDTIIQLNKDFYYFARRINRRFGIYKISKEKKLIFFLFCKSNNVSRLRDYVQCGTAVAEFITEDEEEHYAKYDFTTLNYSIDVNFKDFNRSLSEAKILNDRIYCDKNDAICRIADFHPGQFEDLPKIT